MDSFRNQRGVALVTVILAGAALTVVATTGSFIAIREMRASADDRRGSQAVAHAEAGLERFLNDLKLGSYGITSILTAGCTSPPVTLPAGTIGGGSYSAMLTVYNPNTSPQIPTPLNPWASNTSAPCAGRSTNPKDPQLYAITSTGAAESGTRLVRAVVTISSSSLPVGIFVNRIDANGNPDFGNISVFATGDIIGREKLAFTGNDQYYFLGDVYPGQSMTTPIPTAVHTTGAIYAKPNGKKGVEHPPNPNCTANPRGTTGQSLWDGSSGGGTVTSGCAGQTGWPPTSKFTISDYNRISGRTTLPQLTDAEYTALKANAQGSGIYCSIPVPGTASCTKAGAAWTLPAVIQDADIAGLPNAFVAYFEYAGGTATTQDIKWNATVGPCSSDPAVNRSAVIVVRNGGITFRGGGSMYGNAIAPDGIVDSAGGYAVIGSVIAREMRLRGTAGFRLDACAVANVPSALLNVTPGRWSEVDR